MVVRACKVIHINRKSFTQLCLFHTNQSSRFLFFLWFWYYDFEQFVKVSNQSWPHWKVEQCFHAHNVKKKKLAKNEWLYHKRRETKYILFSAFWCVASRNGKGLKPKWCCHLFSLILCLTEMLQCVWSDMFVSFQRHTDVMTCCWAVSLLLMYI